MKSRSLLLYLLIIVLLTSCGPSIQSNPKELSQPNQKSQMNVMGTKRIVMGWNAFGNTDTFIKQNSNSPNLNVVSPRWFTLANTDRMLSGTVDPRYVEWAHKAGKQVWPLFGNKFDTALTDSVLSDIEKRESLVETIRQTLVQYKIDGINVDFQNMDIKNRKHFVYFIKELEKALDRHDIVVSVDVTRHNPDPFWSGSYDRRNLGKAADYIVLMAYEEYYRSGGKAGPVASIPWVKEGIKLLMKEVPAEKIILAVPFYTREWVTNLDNKNMTNYDRTMEAVEIQIAQKGLSKKWDKKAEQRFVDYVENGARHQIWIEDEKSMEKRLNLVKKYKLAGISAWAIGQESPNLRAKFKRFR